MHAARLTGATARVLAYPPLPAAVSSVSPGTEFPSGERAMDILSKLVRGARALYKGLTFIVQGSYLYCQDSCFVAASAPLCGRQGSHRCASHSQSLRCSQREQMPICCICTQHQIDGLVDGSRFCLVLGPSTALFSPGSRSLP